MADVSDNDKTPPSWITEFETLCLALSRNEPAVTEVGGVCFKRNGPRLGNALQRNTHVSFLELLMDDLVSKTLDKNPVHILPLLNFVQQSQSLHKLRANCELRHGTNLCICHTSWKPLFSIP
jgi:hypothetical protein